jgi:DNA replicative helicase MCM subunit Mcm2 (Cdc46/Mcm family)
MLLEPGEYKIVSPAKSDNKKDKVTFSIDKVKFICKECESTIYVDSYDDIVEMEKTCVRCKNKKAALLRKETIENKMKAQNEKATINN